MTFQWCSYGVAICQDQVSLDVVGCLCIKDHHLHAVPGVVATMKESLGKLEVASTSGDLAALQDDIFDMLTMLTSGEIH